MKLDLNKALSTLEEVATRTFDLYDEIIKRPVVLGVQELGASEVVIRMIAEVQPTTQWHIQRELRKIIKLTFDEKGLKIPFPRMVVYQHNGGNAVNE